MKKNKYILPLLLVLLFTACSEERLDIPQKGVIGIESFYKTDEDAQAALATVYNYLWTTTYANALGIYPFIKNILGLSLIHI